jgi:hypothetical protein
MSGPTVYVQLAPEFGGTAFPPIDGAEYRIGSSDDNHVKVSETLGVEAQHVRLIRKSQDTFYLAPVERSAAVWLFRSGQRDPVAVLGPTVIVAGDSFALATPQGVRFVLMQRANDRKKKNQGRGDAGPQLTDAQQFAQNMQRGLVAELWRRFRAAVLTTWFGRMVQSTWYFIKTRQFLSPVYIIGFLMTLSGWGFSFRSCKQRDTAQSAEQRVKDELAACERKKETMGKAGSASGELPFGNLAGAILGDASWNDSFLWEEMHTAMAAEITAYFQDSTIPSRRAIRERWFLDKRSPWVDAHDELVAAGFDPELARILAWSVVSGKDYAAVRIDIEDRGIELWDINPLAAESYHFCQRGPFRLTWRQGTALGLTVADEATFNKSFETEFHGMQWEAARQQIFAQFNKTRNLAGQELLPIEFRDTLSKENIYPIGLQDGQCFSTLEPDDDRDKSSTVARKLFSRLGQEVSNLPKKGDSNWISGRLAMLYALDLQLEYHEGLVVRPDALGASFNDVKARDPDGHKMIAQRTGETLGRALAAPCAVVMQGNGAKLPPPLASPPSTDYCAILIARAQFNQLGAGN